MIGDELRRKEVERGERGTWLGLSKKTWQGGTRQRGGRSKKTWQARVRDDTHKKHDASRRTEKEGCPHKFNMGTAEPSALPPSHSTRPSKKRLARGQCSGGQRNGLLWGGALSPTCATF